MMTAALNFLGAMVSTGVAKTIGGDIVMSPSLIDSGIISAALIGAITWESFNLVLGNPKFLIPCFDWWYHRCCGLVCRIWMR